jgi:hypothetical protein
VDRALASGARGRRFKSCRARFRYAKTYSVVEAIYGSERLSLPFHGMLLIGY